MAYITDECPSEARGAGRRCEDCHGYCHGYGHGDHDPGLTCMTCGGSGEEPPLLASCPSEGCHVAASFARNNP